MTTAQWLFEYLSLREKENDDIEFVKTCFKALKRMMVNLLGLNLLQDKDISDEDFDKQIVPLSLMTGRREIIETMLKKMESDITTEQQEDEEFDKISEAIAKGEDLGDMAPLFEVDEETEQKLEDWFTSGKVQELEKLGVKVTNDQHKHAVHIDTDVDEINRKRKEQNKFNRQSNEDLLKQLKEEKSELEKHGVTVTFDDNE